MIEPGGPVATTRRAAITGLAAALAVPLVAAPWVRRAAAAEALTAILARSGLAAVTGFGLADVATGALIEGHQPDIDRPPASVAKVLTALYASAALGEDHRFRTALVASGGVSGGRIEGDLALAGGGDPLLDTDALGDLAGRLAAGGVRGVAGRLRVGIGALPEIAVTEADQPEHVGYNPAISGINLNFNRVHLAWRPGGAGPALELTAPGVRHSAPVRTIRAEIAPGQGLRHRLEGAAEVWQLAPTVARGVGSLWLPVRRPPLYAGDVFRSLAARAGSALPEAVAAAGPGPGQVLATHASPPLGRLLREMLHHSTNLTAEVAGLAATQARGAAAESLAQSAGAMTVWARGRYGLRRAAFVNHSGLTVRSRMSAREMLRVLVAAERAGLTAMLRERPILDAAGSPAAGLGARMVAKTGTLWFVRALAGYLEKGGRRLAFAIFAGDVAARAGLDRDALGAPAGAETWAGRARGQENALLRRWVADYL